MSFGFSGKYGKLKSVVHEKGADDTNRKQLGYNSFIYEKNLNEWHAPKPVNDKLDDSLFAGASIHFGDSGGPLIYKNQILGVASYFYP